MFVSYLRRAPLLLAAGIVVSSCGGTGSRQEVSPVEFEDRLVIGENDDKSPLGIPAAQLPAAGQCRLWKPNRPVREQAAAGQCSEIESTAPPESWILYRPQQDPRLVDVRIIDPDQAGLVTQIRVYDAQRGTYLGARQAKRASPMPATPYTR